MDVGTPPFSDDTGTYNTLNDAVLAVLPGPGLPTTMEAKRSGYIATPLGVEGWKTLVDYFATTPNPYNIMVLEPYGAAPTAYPRGDSAFIHREVDCDFFVDSFWDPTWPDCDEETALTWLAGFFGVVQPFLNGEMYQNYPVRDLPDYREQYWGDAFGELLRIKRTTTPPASSTSSRASPRHRPPRERVGRIPWTAERRGSGRARAHRAPASGRPA